ncbi:MAG: PD-(D/E)XK nuclease family protein [Alicyclobacillaceae bacterium]|nr:PD-(D/E)XK nuclease family protein [Alicyclobacillaceae bacterium]
METLTHTRIVMRQQCPMKEHLHYVERLRPLEIQWPLTVGSVWHTAIEALAKGASEDEAVQAGLAALDWIRPADEEEQYKLDLERARIEVMIRFAARRFRPRKFIAVEKEFLLPIINPATGRKSRKFALGGKVDAIAEDEDGRLWVVENKTTGTSIGQFRETYGLNNQLTLYAYAVSRMLERPVAGIIVRAVVKSRAEPKKKGGEIVESWDEYKARLLAAYEAEPDKYLAEDTVERTPEQLAQFEAELWLETQERLWQTKTGVIRHNTANCSLYGGCPFRPLCLGVEGARESMYRVSQTAHDELSEAV